MVKMIILTIMAKSGSFCKPRVNYLELTSTYMTSMLLFREPKLKFISENTPDRMQKFCISVILDAIDKKIEELTN